MNLSGEMRALDGCWGRNRRQQRARSSACGVGAKANMAHSSGHARMLPLAMTGRRNLALAFGKEHGARGKGGHIPVSQGFLVRRTRWFGQRDNPSGKAVIASAKGVLRKRPEIFLRSMAHTPFHQRISHPENDVVLRPPGLYAPRHRCSDPATSLRHTGGHPAAFRPRPPANRRRRRGQPCGFPHASSPWHPCGLPTGVPL